MMRDRKGNVGIIVSANTRGGTLSASLSKYKSKTNAPTIYHQKGTSAQIGGSIDIGASLGLEYVVFPDTTTMHIIYTSYVLCRVYVSFAVSRDFTVVEVLLPTIIKN